MFSHAATLLFQSSSSAATRLWGLRRYIASVTGIYCVAFLFCAGVIYLLKLLVEQFLRLIKLRYTLSKRRKRNCVGRKSVGKTMSWTMWGSKKIVILPIVAHCWRGPMSKDWTEDLVAVSQQSGGWKFLPNADRERANFHRLNWP